MGTTLLPPMGRMTMSLRRTSARLPGLHRLQRTLETGLDMALKPRTDTVLDWEELRPQPWPRLHRAVLMLLRQISVVSVSSCV